MKALIVYDTQIGNTEKIAKVIAKALKAKLIKVNNTKANDVKKADIIGFGSGIYMWSLSQALKKFIKSMPNMQNKRVFIFFTAGIESTAKTKGIIRILREKGYNYMGKFSCKGFDRFGPLKWMGGINKGHPNKEDLEKAKDFAERLRILK